MERLVCKCATVQGYASSLVTSHHQLNRYGLRSVFMRTRQLGCMLDAFAMMLYPVVRYRIALSFCPARVGRTGELGAE